MQALRQALEAAVRWGDMDRNPAKLAGANPPPPPRGVETFTLAEIDSSRSSSGRVYGPMIRFAAATGLRPEEWVALERQDVDRDGRCRPVVRTHVEGRTKPYGKTSASLREVPLSRARSRRSTRSCRGSTPGSCSPGRAGRTSNLRNFRRREWKPALEAAGVPPRRIYDLRSTFASQALAAGVTVFELARIMGTSVRMIERHYGTLFRARATRSAAKLDAYARGFGPRVGPRQRSASDLREQENPALCRVFVRMGGTGLEPVTPSLSSWCSPN